MAGCDLLTISPELLAQLQNSTDPVPANFPRKSQEVRRSDALVIFPVAGWGRLHDADEAGRPLRPQIGLVRQEGGESGRIERTPGRNSTAAMTASPERGRPRRRRPRRPDRDVARRSARWGRRRSSRSRPEPVVAHRRSRRSPLVAVGQVAGPVPPSVDPFGVAFGVVVVALEVRGLTAVHDFADGLVGVQKRPTWSKRARRDTRPWSAVENDGDVVARGRATKRTGRGLGGHGDDGSPSLERSPRPGGAETGFEGGPVGGRGLVPKPRRR